MTDELKPCPFCGSEWVLTHRPANGAQPHIICKGCNASGPYTAGMTEAQWKSAWNTRAEDTALQQRVRELEEALQAICAPLQSWETHSRHSVWAQDTARKALGDTHD